LTLKTTEDSTTENNQDMSKEEERICLQSKLDEYMTGRFLPENSAAGVFTQGGDLVVSVAGEKPNLRNFWSGKWLSNWSVKLSPGQASVSGTIKVRICDVDVVCSADFLIFRIFQVHAHYFEDGNVQLQTTKDIAEIVLPYADVSELATQVVGHIEVILLLMLL
jgi:capping protein alpha